MFHVAIIMDGNGRWATARHMPRLWGHAQGAETVRRVVRAAPGLGITDLTLYAFSSDNWKRPAEETSGLMALMAKWLAGHTAECVENGIRLSAIGRRDRLPAAAAGALERAEWDTAKGNKLRLRLAIDYSSRDTILEAVRGGAQTREEVARRLPAPDVDLLIRTAGERRLSDYLLWECAYAEFHFTPKLWPEFSGADLAEAIADFRSRHRRFGALPAGYCQEPA